MNVNSELEGVSGITKRISENGIKKVFVIRWRSNDEISGNSGQG